MQTKKHNEVREQLEEYRKHHKQVFVGNISTLGMQGLSRYEGEPISSFQYDFAIPQRDYVLMSLIKDWQHDYDIHTLRKIFKEIHKVEGILLF